MADVPYILGWPYLDANFAALAGTPTSGLFTAASESVSSAVASVRTSGYSAPGIGAENYAYDPTIDAAYVASNPLTSFLASDTGGFKLAPLSKPWLTAFGAIVSVSPPSAGVQISNSAAINAAARWGACLAPAGIIWCDPAHPITPWDLGQPGTWALEGVGSVDGSGIGFNCDDSFTAACIRIPEGYIRGTDDALCNPDGSLNPGGGYNNPPGGRQIILKNIQISSYYGKYATVMFFMNIGNSVFENIAVSSGGRGIMDIASFNNVYISPSFAGLYFVSGRTLDQCETQFREYFGFMGTSHYTIINGSFTGWGTGIQCAGPGFTIQNTRSEVNECSLIVGGFTNYYWTFWNGTSWTGGATIASGASFESFATESNYNGAIIQEAEGCHFEALTITGNTGAVPLGRDPLSGMIILDGIGPSNIFENVSFGFSSSGTVPLLNNGSPEWRDQPLMRGASSIFSSTSGRWTLNNIDPNYDLNHALAENRTLITCDSQQSLIGISGFKSATALKFSNNVGAQNVPVTTGHTTLVVAFNQSYGVGTAQFTANPTPVADGNATLNGTYWYGLTIKTERGESGVNWVPLFTGSSGADLTYRSVGVTTGNRIEMGWAGYDTLRRVYRGNASGWFDRYWEIAGGGGAFYDWGAVGGVTNMFADAVPPTGVDFPPGPSGVCPNQYEIDADYGVMITPSWDTTAHIAPADKTTTQFTITFGTAAPAGGTVDWLLYRG